MASSVASTFDQRQFTDSAGRPLALLFTVTIFWSSALLFLLEPMFAKMILPVFGGSPAVWNPSMVFFQVALFLLRLQPLCCTTTPGTIRLDSFNCSVHAPVRAPHRDSICRQSEYGGKPPRDRSCDDCGKQHWASLLYGCGKCDFATEMALANKPPRRI